MIFPLFFLSGSLYPLNTVPVALKIIAACNPISYAVDALRATLLSQAHYGLGTDMVALGITVAVLVMFGVYQFRRIEA